MALAKKLVIKQIRSAIGQSESMRQSLRGLGLKGPGSEVTVANTPSFRGAVKKIIHLVSVAESN
jgi:large subunit ribosomal protein L30